MSPLRQLIIQAKSAANNVAQPIVRRAAAIDAQSFEAQATAEAGHSLSAMLALMKALPELDDPMSIRDHGAALYMLANALSRSLPKPEPRRHWCQGANA
jgi:hypothetical protein